MYNKSLINLANTYIKQNGRISKDEMLLLIHQIENTYVENTSVENTSVENTSVEKETLKYIVHYYNCTVCAINLYNNYVKTN
jgi:hypothetical protein